MILPAKILLFGEQIVLKGAEALAIPLWQLGGTWREEKNEKESARLTDLVNYLEKISLDENLPLNIAKLKSDVFEKHFWFESNVPEGYGAGSSGALIAALYENYVESFSEKKYVSDTFKVSDTYFFSEKLSTLKKQLGIMESFFHGTSSGFDPLVSYIKKRVHIRRGGVLEILNHEIINAPLSIYLIDTLMPRKSETFINIFLKKCTDDFFLEQVNNTLIPENDAAISFFLQHKKNALFESLHNISWQQFRFLSELIPHGFRDIWLESLSSDSFKIKLCGAGGGGFLLCFSKDDIATEFFLKTKNLKYFKV